MKIQEDGLWLMFLWWVCDAHYSDGHRCGYCGLSIALSVISAMGSCSTFNEIGRNIVILKYMINYDNFQNNFSFMSCSFFTASAAWNASADGTLTALNFLIIYVMVCVLSMGIELWLLPWLSISWIPLLGLPCKL